MSIIKEDYPYFINEVHSEDEFTNLQLKLFNKGYQWLNGHSIDNGFVKFMSKCYPLYVSNLPFITNGVNDYSLKKRNNFNQFNNNIIFVSDDKNDFNLSIIRCEKLKKIKIS